MVRDGCFSGESFEAIVRSGYAGSSDCKHVPCGMFCMTPPQCFFAHKTCIYILYDSITYGFPQGQALWSLKGVMGRKACTVEEIKSELCAYIWANNTSL